MRLLALVVPALLVFGAVRADGLLTEARAIAGRAGILQAACPAPDERTPGIRLLASTQRDRRALRRGGAPPLYQT